MSSSVSDEKATNNANHAFATARATFLKVFLGGLSMTVICIFAVFSIYWGALWKTPVHNLHGWVVDFDGGLIGQGVVQALQTPLPQSRITWTVVPASDFSGPDDVGQHILDEKAWVAITINPGASARLSASLATPDPAYNGADALTVYAVEARNENAFRAFIRPSVSSTLDAVGSAIATGMARQASSSTNLGALLSTSPQTLVNPVRYQIINLRPFDQPVATAVTFVGLLYQLILSFFVVMFGSSAREASGLEHMLPTRKLITLRFLSSFVAYFFLSLFYCLLSLAFQLDVTRKYGHGGFMVFWMLNYVTMLSVGLALESLLTVLTLKLIPFFMIMWIIVNVSVCIFPIDVMPTIYRYGYATPFWNVSRAMRAIIFNTKDHVGYSFGILFVWVAISCITLPIFQILVRRRQGKSTTSSRTQEERSAAEEVDHVEVPRDKTEA